MEVALLIRFLYRTNVRDRAEAVAEARCSSHCFVIERKLATDMERSGMEVQFSKYIWRKITWKYTRERLKFSFFAILSTYTEKSHENVPKFTLNPLKTIFY